MDATQATLVEIGALLLLAKVREVDYMRAGYQEQANVEHEKIKRLERELRRRDALCADLRAALEIEAYRVDGCPVEELNGVWLPNNRQFLGQDMYYLPGTEHLLSVEHKINNTGEPKTRAHIETYPTNIPGYSKGWHEGFRETYGDGNFAPTMTILPVRLRVEEVEDEEKGDS